MADLKLIKPLGVQNIINKFCLTIGMIPSSYKLSLTYEEQILSIGKYLEETVIPALNNNAEAVAELQTLFVQLKDYVENYFDNLDLQNEVNKKIDEMVESGILAEIINQEVFEELNNKINNAVLFEEIENAEIKTQYLSFDVEIEETENRLIYITKIPKNKIEEIQVIPCNMNYTNPNENRVSVQQLALNNNNFDILINAGSQGIMIMNNIVYEHVLQGYYYIGFKADNTMHFIEGQESQITSQELIEQGFTNVCPAFSPLLVNSIPFNYEDYASRHSNFAPTVTPQHSRQIIGEDNENYYLFSIMGRRSTFIGMSYQEMIEYLHSKNIINAFNLDGGGSIQEIIDGKMLYPSQDLNYIIGREVPTAIGFKLKGV